MAYPYDLQIHSRFSPDGQWSPLQIFEAAQAAGLKGVALTDHNTMTNFTAAAEAAAKTGLWTCQATEITASHEGTDIHVLGYSYNFDAAVLSRGLQTTVEGYNDRSRKIVEQVNGQGIAQLDFDRLLDQQRESYVSKVNIAQAIAEQIKMPFRDALKILERGGSVYVPYGNWVMVPRQAIELVRQAGGLAVIAHPGDFAKRSKLSNQEGLVMIERLIEELVECGLGGVEVCYPRHSVATERLLGRLVKKHGMVSTGGSDWHPGTLGGSGTLASAGINEDQWHLLDTRLREINQEVR